MRWIVVAVLTLLVTFVVSSIRLRIKHVKASTSHMFWNDGTAWRDVGGGRHARVRFNRERLVGDLIVLPFALLLVLALAFVYDRFAG